MKTKKPKKSLTILGRKVLIKEKIGLKDDEGKDCIGLCDYNSKIIYLEKDQTHTEKIETLVHEATHFFLELTGISQKIDEDSCEIYCQLITALFQDLKDDI